MSDLATRISQAVDAIRLVDTHEHLLAEEERHRAAHDFGYLFPHYASSDLMSAGMPPGLFEAVRRRHKRHCPVRPSACAAGKQLYGVLLLRVGKPRLDGCVGLARRQLLRPSLRCHRL
jgi:hypothetical protein